jgi:hypothetical protein
MNYPDQELRQPIHSIQADHFSNLSLDIHIIQAQENHQLYQILPNDPEEQQSQIYSNQNPSRFPQNPQRINFSVSFEHSTFNTPPPPPPPINQTIIQNKSFSDQTKIQFLEFLSKQFPLIIRNFLLEYLQLPQCPSDMKTSITTRYIKRSGVQDLIKIIQDHSQDFCSFVNEDNCISLLSRTFYEYFTKVPNQKKTRINHFMDILFKVSSFVQPCTELILLQSKMTSFF